MTMGVLIFDNVTKANEGYYLCQANNNVSGGLSKLIKLTVHGKSK